MSNGQVQRDGLLAAKRVYEALRHLESLKKSGARVYGLDEDIASVKALVVRVEDFVKQGDQCLASGDARRACAAYEQAVAIAKDHPDAHEGLQQARQQYDSAKAQLIQAQVLANQGDVAGALDAATLSLRYDRTSNTANVLLSHLTEQAAAARVHNRNRLILILMGSGAALVAVVIAVIWVVVSVANNAAADEQSDNGIEHAEPEPVANDPLPPPQSGIGGAPEVHKSGPTDTSDDHVDSGLMELPAHSDASALPAHSDKRSPTSVPIAESNTPPSRSEATVPRAENTTVARIKVQSPTGLTSTAIDKMDSFPAQLAGSTIHCVLRRSDSAEQGTIEFTVTQSGYLYLALNYSYQGGSGGEWASVRWQKSDFEAAGWTFVPGIIRGPGEAKRDFEICWKLVAAGETYSLRCNKYEPPYPIELPTGFVLPPAIR